MTAPHKHSRFSVSPERKIGFNNGQPAGRTLFEEGYTLAQVNALPIPPHLAGISAAYSASYIDGRQAGWLEKQQQRMRQQHQQLLAQQGQQGQAWLNSMRGSSRNQAQNVANTQWSSHFGQ